MDNATGVKCANGAGDLSGQTEFVVYTGALSFTGIQPRAKIATTFEKERWASVRVDALTGYVKD